jgi:hypothetical protein
MDPSVQALEMKKAPAISHGGAFQKADERDQLPK